MPAARFDRYRRLSEVSTSQRAEYADPHVSDPANAAALIADAILEDHGPMRYGCDPLSNGMLEVWRQSDDEAMFALTGQSISTWSPQPSRLDPNRRLTGCGRTRPSRTPTWSSGLLRASEGRRCPRTFASSREVVVGTRLTVPGRTNGEITTAPINPPPGPTSPG